MCGFIIIIIEEHRSFVQYKINIKFQYLLISEIMVNEFRSVSSFNV